MKRKYVGYQDRKRKGLSWTQILLLDCFRSQLTNTTGFRTHNPASPVRTAKMIAETMMFRRIIGSHPPEVYLENLS
jgi:hypothetical protein